MIVADINVYVRKNMLDYDRMYGGIDKEKDKKDNLINIYIEGIFIYSLRFWKHLENQNMFSIKYQL